MSTEDGACRRLDTLPEELLLKIVDLAIGSRSGVIDSLAELPPFETVYSISEEARSRKSLCTKRSLSQTSSYLRRLVVPLLYEDIWIHHGAEVLLQILQGSNGNVGYGKYVKRIFMPHSTHHIVPDILRKIIESCPDVRILTRSLATRKDQEFKPLQIEDISFRADALKELVRIDWNNVPSDDVPAPTFAPSFIWSVPSLRVLTLGSRNFHDFEGLQSTDPTSEIIQSEIKIDLPNVHTLRLRTLDALGDPFSHWYSVRLPKLRRVVLEAPAGLYPFYEGCLTFYGSSIETIEFSTHVGFLRIDGVALALFYCPNVKELCFPVFNTMPVRKNPLDVPDAEYRSYKVERVVLHGFTETEAGYQVSRSWMTTHLADHVDGLCGEGTRFTLLKTIVLYGPEWVELLEDSFISSLLEILTKKGIKLEHRER